MLPKGKESGKKVGKVLIPLLQVALPPNGDYFAVMSVSLLLDFFDLVFGLRCLLPTSEHIIRVSNIGKVGRKTNERMMAMIMCPSKTLNRVSAVCVAQGGRRESQRSFNSWLCLHMVSEREFVLDGVLSSCNAFKIVQSFSNRQKITNDNILTPPRS